MAQALDLKEQEQELNLEERLRDSDIFFDNGYILNNIYIPHEIIALILSHVDVTTLNYSCPLVCRKWHDIIIDEVWKMKTEEEFPKRFAAIKRNKKIPFYIYRSICMKDSFGRNLIKNNTGAEFMSHWDVIDNGGDLWMIECPPCGVPDTEHPPIVDTFQPERCFATSYRVCAKKQIINLYAEGLTREIMDLHQPHITVFEWYTARWDCAAKYEMSVELLNEKQNVLKSHEFVNVMRNWTDGWKKEEFTFSAYGPGVKYISFTHRGEDLQYWAGHYGPKMTEASIIVTFV